MKPLRKAGVKAGVPSVRGIHVQRLDAMQKKRTASLAVRGELVVERFRLDRKADLRYGVRDHLPAAPTN